MEHASELLPALFAIIAFLAVWILNQMKSEVREIKVSLRQLEVDLRGGVSGLDRRVTTLEAHCERNCK